MAPGDSVRDDDFRTGELIAQTTLVFPGEREDEINEIDDSTFPEDFTHMHSTLDGPPPPHKRFFAAAHEVFR